MDYFFENSDVVRDYECDLQGIVNNANYQHYFEHSRHLFLRNKGVSFAELHNEGIDVVVARVEIVYKTPLRSDDRYVCKLRVDKDMIKYVFMQAIYRESDNKLCARAKTECVAVVDGKLADVPKLNQLL